MSLIDDYAAAIWGYGTRTLGTGTPDPPADYADEIAGEMWGYGARTLTSAPEPASTNLQLVVGTKTFSHSVETASPVGLRFDICRPDGNFTPDVSAQSYINQAYPLADGGESSVLSWSWGLGLTAEIEITGFIQGKKYTLKSLKAQYLQKSGYLEVNREYSGIFWAGNDSFDHIFEIDRGALHVTEGRIGFEAEAVRIYTTDAVPPVVTRTNASANELITGTKRYPVDDYSSYNFTRLYPLYQASWWDAVAEEYTDESVLFAADCIPIAFITEDSSPDYDSALTCRPIYDILSCNNHFGSGGSTGQGLSKTLIRFEKRIRGRVHGITWDGYALPDDPAYYEAKVTSDNEETLRSDTTGYFRSGDHKDPVTVATGEGDTELTPIDSRKWARIAFIRPGDFVGQRLATVSSEQTGRTYLLHNTDGGAYLRIYNTEETPFVDRVISTTAFASAGITAVKGRFENIKVAYDIGGSVSYVQSTDEAKTWSAPVSIVTGTCPQIAYNPIDNVEMVSYFSGSSIYVKRRLGDGAYGSAVAVGNAIESPAPITFIPGSRTAKWVVFLTDTGNAIKRYTSVDSGKAWALDE